MNNDTNTNGLKASLNELGKRWKAYRILRRRRSGHSTFVRWIPLLIFLCLLGTIFANFYSWQMTSTGLLITEFKPWESWLFPEKFLAIAIASVLQFAILLYYVVLPFTFARFKTFFLTTILIPLFLVFIAISALFSAFSLTKSAQGNSFVDNLEGSVTAVHQDITRLDRNITSAYKAKVQAFKNLATNASAGNDRTGVAQCGSICKGWWEKHAIATSQYASLGIAISDVGSTEINSGWQEVEVRRNELRRKLATVRDFNANLENIGINPENEQVKIGERINDLNKYFTEGRQSETNTLVLGHLSDQLKQFLDVPFGMDFSFYLVLFWAFAPDLLSIFLAVLVSLLFAHRGYKRIEDLEAEKIELEEETQINEDIAEAERRNMNAKNKRKWYEYFYTWKSKTETNAH